MGDADRMVGCAARTRAQSIRALKVTARGEGLQLQSMCLSSLLTAESSSSSPSRLPVWPTSTLLSAKLLHPMSHAGTTPYV